MLTYADVVDLADGSPLVVRARITDQVALKPERAPGLAPNHARLFIEAETVALFSGNVPLGKELSAVSSRVLRLPTPKPLRKFSNFS